jgi:hypothetical protein
LVVDEGRARSLQSFHLPMDLRLRNETALSAESVVSLAERAEQRYEL